MAIRYKECLNMSNRTNDLTYEESTDLISRGHTIIVKLERETR